MNFRVIALLTSVFLINGCASAVRTPASVSAPTTSVEEIQSLGYFNKLDYQLPSLAAEIPTFENQLVSLLDQKGSEVSDGLVLAYVAMYMLNTNFAVKDGKISYAELVQFRKYSSDGTVDGELRERNIRIHQLLSKANQLTPHNVNIESWLMGSEIRNSPEHDLSGVLDLLEKDPIFSLFSTLILAEEFSLTPAQETRLFQAVEVMAGPASPCRKKNADGKIPLLCMSTPVVPNGHQGAFTMLADAYLKHGNNLLLGTDTSLHQEGWKGIGISLLLYESLYITKGARQTRHWSRRPALNARMDLAKKIMLRRVPEHDLGFWKTQSAQTVYQCASCHSH